jgi:hypothetical protein
MELEVKEMFEYATTRTCSEPKSGFETQYDRQKEKIRLIQSAKNIMLFRFPVPIGGTSTCES